MLYLKNMKNFMTSQFLLCIILILSLLGCRTRPKLDLNYQPTEGTKVSRKASMTRVASQGDANQQWRTPWKDSIDFTSIQTEDDDWELVSTAPMASQDILMNKVEDRRWVPVYFAFNQSLVGETEREKLEKLADYLERNEQYILVIEGHCDERGSEEYNRALGERRAIAVRDYLNRLGIDDSRIQTLSYGEDKPAEYGDTERAHAQNRRAEFIVGLPK